ncbi:MAG: Serine/threonine-protein kinase AfsK [candidate division BRC1 bacterium ADurb.BinA364]|nr:MAG: Serine/threonine-protein kinase AfsK [candidate division BRC1 bacterium ADurb.BinA364]
MRLRTRCIPWALALALPVAGADQPQWGQRFSRNMVSAERGLPSRFDWETGENIKWSAPLGRNAYGSPSIANGRVLIGANNDEPRDPRHQGDRGVLLCLNETDGSLQWQLVVPRIADDRFKDWPRISICSPPTIEGDRAYVVTNRFEVVCLDLNGMADGNAGPYLDEGRHMAPAEAPAMEPATLDADIVWLTDMVNDLGTYPHDSAHASILLDGDALYLNTCNGVDNTHALIRRPDAPSLIALDKHTGALLAHDNQRIGPRIFHSTWSSPALGEIGGRRLVFFGGGDGVCYAFRALEGAGRPAPQAAALELVWRFDCDPQAPKENVSSYLKNRMEGPSNIKAMPVFHDGRVYVVAGGDIWWGKTQAWLICIDAAGEGDITRSGERWRYALEEHGCSTPSIVDGLLFVADCGGLLHCLDAETGTPYWTHPLNKDVWGSTLAADGKVYVGTRGGDFWIFAAQREKRVLFSTKFKDPIPTTPVAANGVLYVATMKRLYAIAETE